MASPPPGAPDSSRTARAREHLANERTLFAWIRTALALMGLGFVVARFDLFLRSIALQQGRPSGSGIRGTDVIGAGLVGGRDPGHGRGHATLPAGAGADRGGEIRP